jgi:hypothetical protein
MDSQHDYHRSERPVSFDSRDARHGNLPRYSDRVVPLKNDPSSYRNTRGRDGQGHSTSKNLQPHVSLSNMFEESLPHQAAPPAHSKSNTNKGIHGKLGTRLRSLSDTSLYSRPDQGDFEMGPMKQKSRPDNDAGEEYVDEDDYPETEDKTLLNTTKKQTRKDGQIGSSDDDIGNATISLTEFARLEKRAPLNQ